MAPPGYVAIVDDEQCVRTAWERLLRAHGMACRTYASPLEFVDIARSDPPSCLVVDVHMLERTGLELQGELSRRGIRIPTIVTSGSDDDKCRDACRALGAAAFLRKPVDQEALIGAIRSAIR